ncbi:MAG: hypothetical protein LUC92_01790 [Clostridiales bacterium]|nr:hypothetical protein [Clostridiales bacterium]
MLLFMPFFGFSYTTHCLGMILFAFVFIIALTALLREMDFSYPFCAASVFSMVMCISASQKLREIFWGHIIYYSQGILFLMIGMTVLFKILKMYDNEIKTKGFYIISGILALFVMLSATNGIQALTIFILPLIGGLLGEALLNTDIKMSDKKMTFVFKYVIILCVFVILGMALINVLKGDVSGGYEDAYSKFSDSKKWLENLNSILEKWFTLIGVDIADEDDILSLKSIFNIIKIITGTIVPIIPLYMLFNYNKIESRKTRILLIGHWCSTAFILIGWIFDKISNANWRLSPVLCTSLIIYFVFCGNMIKDKKMFRIGVIFMIPLIVVALQSALTIFALDNNYKGSDKAQAIKLIEKNGVDYGYGTFWNANALTVLSNDEVKVRNIQIVDGEIEEYNYQSFYSWYEDQENTDEYFILLTAGEYNELSESGNELINQCVRADRNSRYVLLIYDHNIF